MGLRLPVGVQIDETGYLKDAVDGKYFFDEN